jgi:protein-tyrosine phosphatase
MSVVDVHSHLMPGVDDGARDDDEAAGALARLRDDGVATAITTPHFQGSLTLDPARQAERLEELDRGWERLLKVRARGNGAPDLVRGVEVLLDVPDPRVDDERLRIAGGPFVLVEFPHMTVPPAPTRPLEALRAAGWIPVVAHPERYDGMGSSPDDGVAEVRRWRDAGAYIQVNGVALTGRYGDNARRLAVALLEAGAVDYLGSDYHSRGRPRISDYRDLILELGNEDGWTLLSHTNPGRMAEGKAPIPVPGLRLRRSLVERLLGR